MAEAMKVITLWQPWASLIALGLKRYETRSWLTNYRGPLAIHAAKRPMRRDEIELLSWLMVYAPSADGQAKAELLLSTCPLGEIVAVCNLANCQRMTMDGIADAIGINAQSEVERAVGDWSYGRYAWKLSSVRPLIEPVPYRGRQGLRTISDHATLLAIAGRVGQRIRRK